MVQQPSSQNRSSSDETVENRSASAVVANSLREKIVHGVIPAGERLRQDAIATRFGVSQMIVREAFRQLTNEGFLRAEPRRGVSVAPMNADEAEEMTELRSVIEAKALAWAIPRMSEGDLEEAARILAELDRARSTDRIISLNARFHETLYAPSRKERTLSMISTLRLNFERYLRFTWEETHYLEQSQREHREILRLCSKRDVSGACSLLQSHIAGTGALLIQRLKQLRSSEATRPGKP
ncbi:MULTISPECIES: GntR family transcriptional regulator [unclassified Bradyrhizobium]|uniref:GntR family transcriptional regulator n=1 Tax=unclassified Bradyrhizobium TaxID=2631580 RepID=UPI0028E688A2|nr:MULTISPECIES: GntR family transcriptional regulator [unclassified Bradyrhizobium]